MKINYALIVLLFTTSISIAQVSQNLNPQPSLTDQVAFKAQLISNNWIVNGYTEVIFDSVLINRGNAYDNKTGYFVAPSVGLYYFHAQLIWYATEKPHTVGFKIMKNKSSKEDVESWIEISPTVQGAAFTSTSTLMNLVIGDTVKVRADAAYGGTTTIGGYLGDTHFFGYKVY